MQLWNVIDTALKKLTATHFFIIKIIFLNITCTYKLGLTIKKTTKPTEELQYI